MWQVMDGAPQEPKDDSMQDESRRAEGAAQEEGKEEEKPVTSQSPQSVLDFLNRVSSLVKQVAICAIY